MYCGPTSTPGIVLPEIGSKTVSLSFTPCSLSRFFAHCTLSRPEKFSMTIGLPIFSATLATAVSMIWAGLMREITPADVYKISVG